MGKITFEIRDISDDFIKKFLEPLEYDKKKCAQCGKESTVFMSHDFIGVKSEIGLCADCFTDFINGLNDNSNYELRTSKR